MKFCKLMGVISLALFSGVAAVASQENENISKAEKAKARRAEMRQRMARMSRSIRAKPFGKLADGREAKIWRLQGRGGLALDVTD